jgi:hypothetical protein
MPEGGKASRRDRSLERRVVDLEARVGRLEGELAPGRAPAPGAPVGPGGGSAAGQGVPSFVRDLPDRLAGHVADHENALVVAYGVLLKRGGRTEIAFSDLGITDPSTEDIAGPELCAFCVPFSSPQRIAILNALARGRRSTGEVAERTGLAGGQLYHHLKELIHAGLVTASGRGGYEMTPKGVGSFARLAHVSRCVG